MRNIAALLLLAAAGCVPGGHSLAGDPLPVSTLTARLPQSTLGDCGCPAGEICTCPPGGCSCPGCSCSACPGKQSAVGIAPTAANGVWSAERFQCPLLVFVGTPARKVPGSISCTVPTGTSRVWVGRVGAGGQDVGGRDLPATATDSELLAAVQACVPAGAAAGFTFTGTHSHRDSGGNVWTHSDANAGNPAAHVSPYTGETVYGRYYGPVQTTQTYIGAGSFGGGCAGGRCGR
jgi:hypothetical protein